MRLHHTICASCCAARDIPSLNTSALAQEYHPFTMDYSERVNSKKGAGGVADTAEANVQTKRRIKELLTSQVLDLDNDPYVFRNHLGALECRLCLTTHTNEASYISHLGGRKHALNLEKRRILDEKQNRQARGDGTALAMNNVQRRTWHSIGLPVFKTTKIRDQETLQMGILVQVQCPRIKVKEPFFRLMSCYELSEKNQNISKSYLARNKQTTKMMTIWILPSGNI